MDAYERNIRYYPLHRLLLGLIIIGPILTPYLRSKGFIYTEILLLQSISAVSLVVFEMPTGIVADRVSRRLSLFLSGTCLAIGLTVYIIGQSFAVLALAEILFAVGMTFRSGADSAFLYESLARLGREQEYTRIESKAVSWIFIGQGAGTFVCSLIYAWDRDAPFWVSVVMVLLASAVVLLFKEPEREKITSRYSSHVLQSFRLSLSTPALRWTIALVAIMGFATRTGYWLYEPYFVQVDVPILWYGPIFGVFNIIAAVAARFTHRWRDARVAMLAMLLLLGLTFLLPALFVSSLSITIIALQQIARASYKPTLGAWVNEQVSDDVRATMHSIFGSVAALSFSLLSPLVGLSLDGRGAIPTYLLMGAAVCAAVVLLTGWFRLSLRAGR